MLHWSSSALVLWRALIPVRVLTFMRAPVLILSCANVLAGSLGLIDALIPVCSSSGAHHPGVPDLGVSARPRVSPRLRGRTLVLV